VSGGANTHIFSSVAASYARFRPTYPPALFEWLATLAPARERVWDCACGSGQASVSLAAYFAQVVATDASAAQIAQAQSHARVEYRVAPAERSALADASCDLITVAQALHWFDTAAFYAEARRVGRPGGALAVWTYLPPRLAEPALQARFAAFYRDVVGPYWTPERRHVESGYDTLAFPLERIAQPSHIATLRVEMHWTLEDVLGYVRSWSATVKYVEINQRDPAELLAADLEPIWPAGAVDVCLPLRVLAARL
jgi:ubiquinone/menaquinone biosynthesis C-methylase UbiE